MPKATEFPQNTAPVGSDYNTMINDPNGAGVETQRIYKGDDNILPGLALNYLITRSVSSNNLTVTLTGLDGAAISTTNPLSCWMGGTYRRATAALTKTLAAGTNWMNLGAAEHATKDVDLFVYLIWNTAPATDVMDFGLSRYPGGRVYGDFSTTSTNEKYITFAVAQPAAADPVTLIGRVNVTLSAGAGYTWSVPATSVILNYPIYRTRVLTWTPQHSRAGGAYTNLPTVSGADYWIEGNNVVTIRETHTQHATPGSSGAQRFTLPFSNLATTAGTGYNASTDATVYPKLSASAPTVATLAKYDGTAEVTASQIYVTWATYQA